MKEELKQYIKKQKYDPNTNKTEILIGNFSNLPIDPIDVISKIISHFNSKNHKIIVDDYLSYNNGGNWNSHIIFNSITFNKEVAFKFYSFEDDVSFINCTFREGVIFGKSILKKSIGFINCIFKNNTNFWGTFFYSTAVFSESRFEGVDNNFWQSHFYGDVFCENINVRSNISFSDTIFEENVYFKEAILKGKINFSNVKFKNSQKDNIEEKQKKEIDFSRVVFDAVTFNNTDFQKNVRFHETVFNNNVDFFNTSFKGLADFYLVKFEDDQQFHTTDFLDRAIFSNTTFKGETQFIYNKVDKNSYINFESAKFEKGLDISRANFNCNLNFWNIYIQDESISKSTKYIDDFAKHKKEATPSVYKQLRETYRIIKNNFYKQNNIVEELRFYEKEMSIYLEEKRTEDKKPINKIIPIEKIIFYPIAKLSSIREKYGRKYDVPIIVSNFIIYLLFVYCQSHTYFWILFLEAFLYVASLLYPKKKDIKNTIKQNNYISLIVLFASMLLLFVPIYNVVPKKNTSSDYICIFIEKVSSLLRNDYEYIILYLSPFIAIFLIVLFIRRERLLLWFNKNSNEFGGNWVASVNFTIFVALITYFLILLPISCSLELSLTSEGVGNFLRGLVDILNITDWRYIELFGEKPTNWQYVFLFIGRIFVAYGIYQTIQAFRKFGKS